MSYKPTIQDIADRAGVGAGTVSRVLNNHPNVSERTRQKVLEIIADLDYRPDFSARQMRTRRSQTIGFITDEIATAPYGGELVHGAQNAALASDRFLLIINTGGYADVLESALETLIERRVEGIIYAAMYHQEVELPDLVHQVPTVLANCFVRDASLPAVFPDERDGGYQATQALLEAGHRRIAFINLEPEIIASGRRLQGYREALQAFGVAYDEDLVTSAYGNPHISFRQTKELLALPDPPTAVFAGNDRTAMGVYDAIKDLSLKIPADVAVVGFDNYEIIATSMHPMLTTIQLPHEQMGRWAVQHLFDHILNGAAFEPVQMGLACPLLRRDSV